MKKDRAIKLIESNSKIIPSANAITYRDNGIWKTMSWKVFWNEVCQTANGLLSLGLQDNDNVCIFSQNSKDWIIFDIAVQITGGVTVPVYATNSYEQARYIVNETDCNFILTGSEEQTKHAIELRNEIQRPVHIFTSHKNEETIKYIYELTGWNKQFSDGFEFEAPGEEKVATIIYTSGTTGIPKGVMLTHSNFAAVVTAHKQRFNLQNMHGTRSMAFLPLSHVYERAWTIFVLSQGGEVVALDNPKDILTALKETKPTALCSVPRLYEKIYQSVNTTINQSSGIKKKLINKALLVGKQYAEKKRNRDTMPLSLKLQHAFYEKIVFKKIKSEFGGRLNFLPVGGAMIKKEISEFMHAIGMPVIVGYGLTETSATVTCYPRENYEHGSVGSVLPGIEIKIGADDEILVKSDGVMKGYYNQPEETQKIFTEDGFLKTGDCGRIDENGNLFITDRIKDLMKTSNGKYIAPQPIEVSLLSSPEIAQAMIIADERPYVTSLIVPDFEILALAHPDFRTFQILSDQEKSNLLNSGAVKEKFQKIIDDIQKKQSPFEKIKHFRLLPKEFTIESGELTPTLKIKRSVVLARLKPVIDSMYGL